ncbi:MAG: magnesium transporter [Phycisphaeraceae bacterium]|nr:magnesium transporter [Phycisphaeraceae bacterium]
MSQTPTPDPQRTSEVDSGGASLALGLEPWQALEEIIDSGNAEHLTMFLNLLVPADIPYSINQLDEDRRTRLFSMIDPELAADLMEHLSDGYAADVIEELSPQAAAAIVDEMDSDDQADILAELNHEDAQAILQEMDPTEARDARTLGSYPPDVAGGLMVTEYLHYDQNLLVDDVISNMRAHAQEFSEYLVVFLYVTGEAGRLVGVVRLRDLLLAPRSARLGAIMITQPRFVRATDTLDDLASFFDHHSFGAVPVIDEQDRLVGVVLRAAVQAALGERADRLLMRAAGIVTGEELRSQPMFTRSLHRLMFLVPSIALVACSTSIIAFHEGVIQRLSALAIFLPMVAGMSGASAQQSISVSIRELTLGLIRPRDTLRVAFKEVVVGAVNGLVIGLLLAGLAWVYRSHITGLPIAVGVAFAVNSIVAVTLGGIVPLGLHKLRLDPAMASGPMVATLADIASFFLLIELARHLVPALALVP